RQLFASLAELDRNTIVETMRDGMVRKARHGQLLPTYARPGYDWNALDSEGRKAKGAHLVVNEKEAELVRLIFDKYPSMKTNHRLVLWLNGQGYRLPCKSVKLRKLYGRNERMFDSKALGDIIRNELYTGTISWGKKTNMQGQMPEEFRHHFPELQIVSFEVFNRCQAVMMERRKVPSKSQGSPYMFSGLVRCPICRGKTVGKRQWHSDYNYQETRRYKCRSYHIKGPTACKGWACDEQTIRKAVVPFLVDLLENRLKVMDSLEEAARLEQKQYAGDRGQALQAEIANAGRVIVKAQEGYEAEVYTAEQARARIYGARERKEKAERQLRDMEAVSEVKE
ncbi:MAG: recombinase family protein, partial [Dehalococcoidia bacterium]|nr:recombinase family protein [Dehalococcoidia bacterium]